jgi:hypothetical protein
MKMDLTGVSVGSGVADWLGIGKVGFGRMGRIGNIGNTVCLNGGMGVAIGKAILWLYKRREIPSLVPKPSTSSI